MSVSDALMAEAKKDGWTVISMKDDWKTIFPPARQLQSGKGKRALFLVGLKSNRPIGDVGPRIPPIQTWALLSPANGLTRRSHPPTFERMNSTNRPS